MQQSEVRYSQHNKRVLRQMMRRIHNKEKLKSGRTYAEDKAYLAVNLEYWRF